MTGTTTTLSRQALARLMPLHLELGADGQILGAGPTLVRLCRPAPLVGASVFAAFEILRPAGVESVAALGNAGATALKLRLRATPDVPLRAVAVDGGQAGGAFLNLSFGIALVDAVRRFGLTNDDFAATDLAIEMLYLVEAKSAAFEESRRLNTRLHSARVAAEEQALTDTLTGLKNRRAMDRVIARLLDMGEDFGLMHIDLDYFKEVNDRFGHAAGDHVLLEVAHLLLAEARATDTVARVGGDEFVIILRDLLDRGRLERIAERIVARLTQPIDFLGEPCRVSASIGAVISTIYARPDAHTMLRDADAALYLSKRQGRCRATLVSRELLDSGALATVLAP